MQNQEDNEIIIPEMNFAFLELNDLLEQAIG